MRLDGQQIGRYHFERYLGSGGMGDVYLATDPRIQLQVEAQLVIYSSPLPSLSHRI